LQWLSRFFFINCQRIVLDRERSAGALPAGTQGFFGAAAAKHMGMLYAQTAAPAVTRQFPLWPGWRGIGDL